MNQWGALCFCCFQINTELEMSTTKSLFSAGTNLTRLLQQIGERLNTSHMADVSDTGVPQSEKPGSINNFDTHTHTLHSHETANKSILGRNWTIILNSIAASHCTIIVFFFLLPSRPHLQMTTCVLLSFQRRVQPRYLQCTVCSFECCAYWLIRCFQSLSLWASPQTKLGKFLPYMDSWLLFDPIDTQKLSQDSLILLFNILQSRAAQYIVSASSLQCAHVQ